MHDSSGLNSLVLHTVVYTHEDTCDKAVQLQMKVAVHVKVESIPPARHIDLGDDKSCEQMEEGIHVGGADSCNLHIGCDGHSYHS